jgi:D-glycero-D-manno-heptose 1,7-bisphosphate phosphatase
VPTTPKINWSNDVPKIIEKMSKRPLIGLDRDGTINVDLGTYVTTPEDFKPIEGSLESIAELRRLGFKIVIITNQGGIEKGIMTQQDVDNVNQKMLDLLGEAGCSSIDALYYSASSRKDDMYAKPNTGMFKRCEKENPHLKFKGGYYVGDKMSDLRAAIKVGAKPILVRTGYGLETEKQLKKFTYKDVKKKTAVFDDLSSFVKWIITQD